jgi:hypothetical protein
MQDPTIGKRTKRDDEDVSSLPQSKLLTTDPSYYPLPAAAQTQRTEDVEIRDIPIENLLAHTLLPPPRRPSPSIEDCQRRQRIMEVVYSYENQIKINMPCNIDNSYHNHIPNEQAKWNLVVEKYPETTELIRKAALLGDYDAITFAGYLNIPGYEPRDRINLC